MSWNTFLINASQYVLGTSQTKKEARRSEALDRLCEMVGVVRVKQERLTQAYFDKKNKENIEKDLEVFAQAGGLKIGALSTWSPK